jgi:hypothetical protein
MPKETQNEIHIDINELVATCLSRTYRTDRHFVEKNNYSKWCPTTLSQEDRERSTSSSNNKENEDTTHS